MKKIPRNLSLNALKSFSTAADCLSISRASEELHVTQGAISRQVKHVENSLRVKLFTRRNRGIFLTKDGLLLHQTCKEAFTLLGETLERLEKSSINAPLVVSCEPTLAIRWLIPRLPTFQEECPDIQIHLFSAGGEIDLHRSRVDLALRRNDFTWEKNYYSELIAKEKTGPVCTIDMWDKNRSTFNSLCLLHTQTRSNSWSNWKDLSGYNIKSESDMHFEHFYLSLQAASSGLGIAIGSKYMTHDDITNKRLIAPMGFINDGSEYYLISEDPIDYDERKKAFKDWLKGEFHI